ncbi:nidogen-2 isoform X2 [Fundulus heteroclitus]|uniref:nidogen-2 isoform X2 n=1 Tax=Fundulus heteroclitus TaxID=8078 RepID=UPI00165AC7A1|nr:nidogen-2 isoform X2 [Fundulus heteroclitus]
MDRGAMLTAALLCCWSLSLCVVTAIRRTDLFPYGALTGDLILPEGDDETSRALTLPRPFYFFDSPFSQLYVATNGIISAQDLPMEKQYVDDGLPTDFPVVAPFLADIDTSGGRGSIYYRVTETPSVLNRLAKEVHRGFPDAQFTPTHAVVATWENVAAYEEQARATGALNKVNTFQAVIGYDETDSFVLFLYPEDGLRFFGTRPKESYNVEIELPARVGFSRGEVPYFIISKTDGPFYSVAQDEYNVKKLSQVGNTGVPGVWLFHTGKRYSFQDIIPASTGGLLATPPTAGYGLYLDTTTPEYEFTDYTFEPETEEEVDGYTLTGKDPRFQPNPAGRDHPESRQPGSLDSPSQDSDPELTYNRKDVPLTLEPVERQYAPPGFPLTGPEERAQRPGEQQPQLPLEVVDVYPPLRGEAPLSPGGHVVSVDEDDVDFDTGVIQYTTENKETCARFQQQCSQNAFCSDYPTGFCCHCRPGFYGNGRQCLPDGAPQRVSGKVSGTLTVGSTPVELNNIDLHAYIVVGDGRAYTAISEVPEPVGWAMMPVSPIGELFGWLFALELPNSQAGFKITGAEFSRHAEVLFNPGNQRLSIMQTGRGLDEHNHLSVDTVIKGNVPYIPPGAEVTMEPFKETYQYYPSVATSSSIREFSVVSAERGTESYTFHLKQNITYRDCRHHNRDATPETLQINMERVFVMYVKEERILRYAITNKISPVGDSSGVELLNPCYAGTHDCDTTAQCIPLEGQDFRCQCATGYRGDGQNCNDIDECAEGLSSCGDYSQCLNLPGTHRCQCQSGFESGHSSHTCVDIDECSSSPCHISARCVNELGSFQCQCLRGFYGDGFHCSPLAERPGSQCERHRDSLQSGGQTSSGAYIPQCDSDGQYRPRQCHGSTGHCWCVDSSGQEKPGTRTPPGTAPKVCDALDEPERARTQCEHHRDSVQTTGPDGLPLVGAYVPQCDENGQYVPQQCHDSTGHCWCVDSRGQERAGTRSPPGTPRVDCSRADEPERARTHCEHHRDSVQTTGPDGLPLVGAYVPQCDENGQYVPQQCHGSTGHCWCVDSRGQERAGTRSPPGTPRVDCSRADELERARTHCEHHRDSVQTTGPDGLPLVGAYVPQCDENGQYVPQQCHSSTGHCWCVDSRGQERAGTRSPPGTPRVDCSRADEPERARTHCEHHRDSVQTTGPDGLPLVGAYVPQCDENGQYVPQQCHGSTGHCWCVDSRGQERAGTRSPPGTPRVDCSRADEPERPKTHCEHHRHSVQTSSDGNPPPGAYVPECDENGQYLPQQCHGSTGHCWCVDNRGEERAGTRSPPGAPRVDCSRADQPQRPKTPCEHQKERAQATGSQGYPVAGAYVPQCDADGLYIPLQCHTSTGYCWCVNKDGQERAGTRTPPGSQPKDCVKPDAPKTRCEEQRDRAQANIQEQYPSAGVFVPRCDAEGQYLPRQCHGSTGHCWCVDSSGQERAGTRTPPGATPVDCKKPASNNRQESVCERWRASLIEHYGGKPDPNQYLPQCEPDGEFSPVQCYGESSYCWCVDQDGREVPGTRSNDAVKPACLPSVAPPVVRPVTRPDVTPPANTDVTLLYAQGQKIGALPLNGTRLDAARSKTLLTLHGSIVVGMAYDCKENKVYWTDLSARTINRASMASGAEAEMLINTDLVSPEGLAVDAKRRLMFWVDSNMDVIESADLDGSRRRTLFDSDLVNPRAIIAVSSTGSLYWTDWNREAPKIETSTVDGQGRRVVVSDGIGLPNALTYDSSSGQICWADAGTKRLECISPNGSGRRLIHSDLNYPFSMVYYSNHFYYSDWRRDGVIALSKDSSKFTDEYLPDQRSHLYGITIATTHCLPGSH